jgi:GT2 family glycosyltransferase
VLHYRALTDTVLAVRALAASRAPVDIIVVDNDVALRCDAALAGTGIAVTYLSNERNLGFSGGMNVGIRAALNRGASEVLLVNSDAIVPPRCVAALASALADPRIGIAAPELRSRSLPRRVASRGIRYTMATGRMRHIDAGTADDVRPSTATVVDAVSGAVMLIRREVFEAVGLLDEDYFYSFEDIEFCLRARRAGFATVVAPCVAYHEGGQSMGADSPHRLYFAARNHLLMASRLEGGLRPVVAASIVSLNVAHAITADGGHPVSRVRAVIAGTWHYFRDRAGAGASRREPEV